MDIGCTGWSNVKMVWNAEATEDLGGDDIVGRKVEQVAPLPLATRLTVILVTSPVHCHPSTELVDKGTLHI